MPAIWADMRPRVQRDGLPPTPFNMWSAFVRTVRSTIRIILCMSPQGEVCERLPASPTPSEARGTQ